ncbi:alpha/beta hydrolase [Pedobacter agri]|uniref:alpha/beta hydrolase n=1 Tax=Pedobacter agri TaxID=454586 RepID=UPI002931460D|nr:alpha/beta hydrolase [Pedobacter agri]
MNYKKKSKEYLLIGLTATAFLSSASAQSEIGTTTDKKNKTVVGSNHSLAASSQQLPVKVTRNQVNLISNIVFSQAAIAGYPNYSLKMDLLQPKSDKPLPLVVYITGGGFIASNKDSYLQQRFDIAEAGYVVASIEYRVAPTAAFPSALIDVKSAIRYLKGNAAKFGIDKSKIAVFGDSAGGYLAALAGATNDDKMFDKGAYLDENSVVHAVVDLYGLSDLTKVGEGYPSDIQDRYAESGSTQALWVNGSTTFGPGGGIDKYPAKAQAANPIFYIKKDAPPYLIMHGEKDQLVSPFQTERLHLALLEKGVKSTRYVVPNAAHGGDYWQQPEVIKVIVDFLNVNLK